MSTEEAPKLSKKEQASTEKLSKKEQAFTDAKVRGNDAVSAGRWASAVEAYTEALRAGPSNYFEAEGPAAAVLSNRSLAHLKCHLFDKALQVCIRSMSRIIVSCTSFVPGKCRQKRKPNHLTSACRCHRTLQTASGYAQSGLNPISVGVMSIGTSDAGGRPRKISGSVPAIEHIS